MDVNIRADSIAFGIDDGKMCGLPWFQSGPYLLGGRDRRRVDLAGSTRQIVRRSQLDDRHIGEVWITEVIGAVGKYPLLDFSKQMNVARRVQLDALEVGGALLLDTDQLGQRNTAGAG